MNILKAKNFCLYNSQLIKLLEQNISILDCFKILSDQDKLFKHYSENILKTFNEKGSIYIAIQSHIFSYISLRIHVNTSQFDIKDWLSDATTFIQSITKVAQKQIKSFIYPCLLILFLICNLTAISFIIIPKITLFYEESGLNPPMIVALSNYFTKNFSFIISLLIVIIYLNYSLFLWCKKNKPVRFNLINTKEIEFLWLIKSTISCGLSLKQLLKEQAHLKNIHPSYYIFYTQLNKTGQLAHALKESGFINHTDYLILNHAEKINQLSSSLNYVIKNKIKTFSNKLDLFLSCLKPVLFLLIAALICSAFSMTFYPILNLLNEFGIQ